MEKIEVFRTRDTSFDGAVRFRSLYKLMLKKLHQKRFVLVDRVPFY